MKACTEFVSELNAKKLCVLDWCDSKVLKYQVDRLDRVEADKGMT